MTARQANRLKTKKQNLENNLHPKFVNMRPYDPNSWWAGQGEHILKSFAGEIFFLFWNRLYLMWSSTFLSYVEGFDRMEAVVRLLFRPIRASWPVLCAEGTIMGQSSADWGSNNRRYISSQLDPMFVDICMSNVLEIVCLPFWWSGVLSAEGTSLLKLAGGVWGLASLIQSC